MGYSYWESFEKTSQSNVINSLHIALQKPNCASNDLEVFINNGSFRFLRVQENVLRLVNETNEILSISFPAVLDLDGTYSCIPPNSVIFILFFALFPFFSLTKIFLKASNSPFEQYASAIFQLSPLKSSPGYQFSTEIMHSCLSAINIMQTLYHKTELIIRNRKFCLFSFEMRFIVKPLKKRVSFLARWLSDSFRNL